MRVIAGLTLCICFFLPGHAAGPSPIDWLSSDVTAFERARAENKPVLLYLEAVWCHWCHVIDRETYGNPEVAELVNEHFVPLRIDQDARPDLANRYRDYGWPATIWFTPDGRDMVKRQGYIAPGPMARLLRAIIADPTPEAAAALNEPEEFAATSSLPDELREELTRRHVATHDPELGGLTMGIKMMDRDAVEYDMVLCGDGDERACTRARRTLDAAIALIDPVWGGVYQYSTYGDWDHAHFEKLGTIQGEYLRAYALAYGRFRDDRYLQAANDIRRYIADFLTDPGGGFYASQDADLVQGRKAADYFALGDAERREKGIPRVDSNIYSRESGIIAEGLVTLHELARDPDALDAARRAVDWIEAHRSIPGGGFRHGESDSAGPYLADNLAMGRAYLALYKATAQREWLSKAGRTAAFVDEHFRYEKGGYASAAGAAVIRPVPQIDENIALARFANLLARISGDVTYDAIAREAMRYLTAPAVATRRITEAGVLLADRELNRDPLHLTVIGSKADEAARALWLATLDQPGWYKRAEWWDRSEGPLPNPDVTYPQLKKPAAFVCTEKRCSLPIFQPGGLAEFITSSTPTVQ